jgi:pyruvate/2-oxoglutarate dehydrogenase complex dihydrolipoamide dehydrogenase (E3) component
MKQIIVQPDDKYNRELVANVHPADHVNPTPDGRYNLVVMGGGSAGLVSAIGAAGVGAKVALIEKHLLGGDCLNVGCVPSKAVIRAAKAVGEIRRAGDFGVHVPEGVTVDFGAVMERMRRIRTEISHHDSVARLQNLGIDVFLGEAQFTGRNQISIGGQTLEFSKAVIATGSRAAFIPIPGLAEAGYLINETLFELTERPSTLAIIGAGPIGAEMTQAFQRLGSQVILFDILPQILGREDEEAAAIMQQQFESEGIQIKLVANIKQVTRTESGQKKITFAAKADSNGQEQSVIVDEILLAAGRTPNLEGLNLEAAGVEYTKKGLVVNDYLQTSNGDIYGAGDVAIPYQFTHTADATARIVVRNALFFGRAKMSDLTIPWVTYTDPEVAHVGLYPRDAAEKGIEIDTFTTQIGDVDRGRTDGEEGFVKIHVKKGTDKIIGATIVGTHAGELISEVTTAMVAGAGLKTLSTVIHPYPTQAEAIKKTADAFNRTRLTPTVAKLFDTILRWRR